MRAYHFSTFYLSSIQQGIQAAHAQTEAALKYGTGVERFDPEHKAFGWYQWAVNHKTMICLNIGGENDLRTLKENIRYLEGQDLFKYAWADFYESKEALGGILTNVMVIVPENIYAFVGKFDVPPNDWNTGDTYIWTKIRECSLAR